MTALVDQDANHAPHRLAAVTASVQGGIEEQVDPGVTVLRLVLLDVLDQARHDAVDLDRQTGRLGLVPWETVVRSIPPTHHLGGRVDAQQLSLITFHQRTQNHACNRKGRI